MDLELCDIITAWLDGPEGINHQLQYVPHAPDPAPAPIQLVANAFRDESLVTDRLPPVDRLLVVGMPEAYEIDQQLQTVQHRVPEMRVAVNFVCRTSGMTPEAVVDASRVMRAVVRSLDAFNRQSGPHKARNGVRVGPLMSTSVTAMREGLQDASVLGGLIAAFQVKDEAPYAPA